MLSDLFVGAGSDIFENSLFIHPNNINLIEAEFSINLGLKLLPTILSIFGATLALILYNKFPFFLSSLSENHLFWPGRKIYKLLNNKYYFDIIYNNYIISSGYILGYIISKEIDRGSIELIGPYGISNSMYNLGKDISKLDTGIITTYALYFTIALLFFICFIFSNVIFNMYPAEGVENSLFTIGGEGVNIILRLVIILIFSIFYISKNNIK